MSVRKQGGADGNKAVGSNTKRDEAEGKRQRERGREEDCVLRSVCMRESEIVINEKIGHSRIEYLFCKERPSSASETSKGLLFTCIVL